ncbi:MAG: hypothetical protein JG782_1593 [Anaerophaga sp.]|uniref:lysophospholipid acyltransferase family protein n=1 Tax=Anaerophaga thermohalophila TaxID=177400 RepID=UPI000237BAE0|nr:lysophospholipid acyltransferase family protein [Anaerophaga thermohalophila]MBZ4676973.1 hypothetical protein [Anaerophaga sp.]MDI3521363.1 hypothetical protein [Anaerophaga sp.]
MIKANHHPFFVWFFRLYTNIMIRIHFRKVYVEGDTEKTTNPLLVVSNHFSWWDGFFIFWLNNKFWKKIFYVMMLEEQLAIRKFLSRTGAFSIKRGQTSDRHSLRYATEILQNNENLLLMYPQGEIRSQLEYPVHFKNGAEFLIKSSQPEVKMVVVLTDYFSFRKPSLFFYIKNVDPQNEEIKPEALFNNFMHESIEKQKAKAKAISDH